MKTTHTLSMKKQGWEAEFDKRFLVFTDPDIVDGFAKDEIKSFIRYQLATARAEERERVRKDIIELIFNADKRVIDGEMVQISDEILVYLDALKG